jgi:tetratricopeptide (TPR) repeat protein
MNNIAAAQSDVDRMTALRPNDAKTYNLRCWIGAIEGERLDAALADCNAALRLSPGDANYLDSLGFVQFRRGDYKDALQALNAALQDRTGATRSVNLQRASSFFTRSRCERRLGNSAAADADLASAHAIDPQVERLFSGFNATGAK